MSPGSSRLPCLLVASFLAACASGPQAPSELRSQSGVRPADGPKDLPAPEPTAGAETAQDAPQSKGEAPSEASASPRSDPTVIVIEEAAEQKPITPQDLVAASRLERERRERAGKPLVVITDKNLAQHARNGRVTTGTAPRAAAAAPASNPTEDREGNWRFRMRGLRLALRDAFDRLPQLEKEAADQRIRFYSEDDPYVRDGRIKPAWDRALELLEAGRQAVETAREAIARALDEGRQAGAEPGWLLEGVELEPPADAPKSSAAPSEPRSGAEPREPNVVEEPPV